MTFRVPLKLGFNLGGGGGGGGASSSPPSPPLNETLICTTWFVRQPNFEGVDCANTQKLEARKAEGLVLV